MTQATPERVQHELWPGQERVPAQWAIPAAQAREVGSKAMEALQHDDAEPTGARAQRQEGEAEHIAEWGDLRGASSPVVNAFPLYGETGRRAKAGDKARVDLARG